MSYELADGLGFSLKPPKAIRKVASKIKKVVTLKNVLKVGAIAATVAIIPGAAPLLAKTVVGAGKLALGAGKYVGKGLVKAGRSAVRPLVSRPAPAPSLANMSQAGAATRAGRNAALRARLASNAGSLARSRLSTLPTSVPFVGGPILTASAEGGGIEVQGGTLASAARAAWETVAAARSGSSPIAVEQGPDGPVARASTPENAEQAPDAVTTAGFGGGASPLVLAGFALAAVLLLRGGGKVRRARR